MAPLMTIDVVPAESAQTVTGKESIVGINIVQAIHETEWSVAEDCTVTLQPVHGLNGKAPDVIHAGLVTTIKVLASKLRDTDRLLESVGPLLDVDLEVREMHIIPMEGNLVDMAVTAALGNEVVHPREAVRGGCSARASKSVTLSCERSDVLVPTADSITDGHVSLVVLIDLIESVCVGSVTGLGFIEPVSDTVGGETPEHDADGDTRVLDGVRNGCLPKMEYLDTRGR